MGNYDILLDMSLYACYIKCEGASSGASAVKQVRLVRINDYAAGRRERRPPPAQDEPQRRSTRLRQADEREGLPTLEEGERL